MRRGRITTSLLLIVNIVILLATVMPHYHCLEYIHHDDKAVECCDKPNSCISHSGLCIEAKVTKANKISKEEWKNILFAEKPRELCLDQTAVMVVNAGCYVEFFSNYLLTYRPLRAPPVYV